MSLHDHRFEIAASASPDERLWRRIVIAWTLASLLLLVTCATAILRSVYPDPDDILRLLEVRDLLNGQSWWDVDQHRLASGMMHWSRLVDLPLATIELMMRPFVGPFAAERVALAIVPLLTLGCVMALGAVLTRRLLDVERAGWALMIAPMSVPLVYQMRPMRIDHHGWQVALAMGALLAFVSPRANARSGAVGGLCLATLLTISLEGLPIAAALLGIVALGWVIDPTRRPQLVAATGTAFGSALFFHLITRGPHFWTPACDAMAPVWLAVLGTAAVGSVVVTTSPIPVPDRYGLAARTAAMAIVGVAAGGALLLVDPRCTAGPFQMLPPLVRQLWYENVLEGLPVWRQPLVWAVADMGLPIVGLVGSILALRAAANDRRAAWWITLGALAAAFLLSLLVSRSAATANAFALPGSSLVITALLARARRLPRALPRTLATAGAMLVVAPSVVAVAAPVLSTADDEATADRQRLVRLSRVPCSRPEDIRALRSLPAGTLFAPIDIAPEIIASTSHHAIASGHHRNARTMADVLGAFTDPPAQAETIIRRYHADYVVGCPGFSETRLYDRRAPDGLWARLERGERFRWLTPVQVPGSPILAWRVMPLQGALRRL